MNYSEEVRKLRTELIMEVAIRMKAYDDAHPEIGMPPQWKSYVLDALKYKGFKEEDVDMDQLL